MRNSDETSGRMTDDEVVGPFGKTVLNNKGDLNFASKIREHK